MKNIFLLLFILHSVTACTQDLSPENLGFKHEILNNKNLGKINYYLSLKEDSELKPLLVYLDGSGPFPLFQKTASGITSTVVIDFQSLQKDYRVLLISKPDVPFFDEVSFDSFGFPSYSEPEGYTKRLSLDWRVNAADLIINELISKKEIDSSKVVIFGFSEGAQVAPFLAKKNKYVSHLMLFGGNGLNQFFDPIITSRLKSTRGEISEEQAQLEIDSLFKEYAAIYNEPQNTDKTWWGHTNKRWSSFTQIDPVDVLLELEIPIYIANGSLDENSILSADYIYLSFLRNRKNNLTYKTYPGYDHSFNLLIFEDGEFKEAHSKLDEVVHEALQWLRDTD